VPEVVLVAGRGPMAVRAIRSCQESGAKVVAVYSEAEANSLHARLADDSVLIGSSAPEASYLDIAALVEAAQVSGAHAVLPVHSILAGSADFARATIDAGLLWIGPSPTALTAVDEAGWGASHGVAVSSPGSVIGLADGFRLDGLLVRRTTAEGATLRWTSAEEPPDLALEGFPSAAELVAQLSDLVGELGWRGLVCVSVDDDGAAVRVRGGVPAELGLVELRAGRDLLRAAIALAEDGTPPAASPGAPAAVGGSVRARAVPPVGGHASITELTGPESQDVEWTAGYATGDPLWPWYDPVLVVIGVAGDDVADAVDEFLEVTAEITVTGVPTDLDDLRVQAGGLAARLRDGSA